MRVILPVVVGAVFGALVVTILLRSDNADEAPVAVPAAVQRTPPSSTDAGPEISGDALIESESETADRAAILDDITSISDAAARRRAALALLEVYGHDVAGIDRIAAALPPDEAVNFRIDAIVRLGTSDVSGAIAAVMALPDYEQRRLTLLRLAPVVVSGDPLASIAAIERLEAAGLQTTFAAALVDAWAIADPAGVFDYLESADAAYLPDTGVVFEALAASDPDRLFAMADDLRRDLANQAMTAALEAMVERDPVSALSRIAVLPQGADRSGLEYMAAEAFGERNPEAAWEWATENEADALSRVGVVRGIQKADPDMAWEIMQRQLNSADVQARAGTREYLMNYVNAIVSSDSPEDIVTGLDRLLSLNDPFVDSQMQTNLQVWADRDPEAALDWSLRNLDRINADRVLSRLSGGLARSNIDLARQTVFRLDEAHRASWAAGVGRTLAGSDIQAARSWAYEFPSGPLRDAGLQEVIRGEAQGGTVDRQLFEQFSSDQARGEAARAVAQRFACDGHADRAREIAAEYVTSQRMLDEIERGIEPGSGSYFPGSFLCQFEP